MTTEYITYSKHKQKQNGEETLMPQLSLLFSARNSDGWAVYSAWVYIPGGSPKTK